MDTGNLIFDENSFNVVVIDEMIHHVNNLDWVVGEMLRVLKLGWVAVTSDHNKWSLASDLTRSVKFGKEKEKVFSAGENKPASSRPVSTISRIIIFCLPFRFITLPNPL